MFGQMWCIYVGAVLGVFFLVFSLQQLLAGRTVSKRISQDGGSLFLSTYLMEFIYWILRPVTRACVAFNVSPNFISCVCLVASLFAAVFAGMGEFALAGWAFCLSSIMDALDGMVARESRKACVAGELIDTVIDRIAEFAFFFGMVMYYRDDFVGMLLVFLALLGSVLVSYLSAVAGSLSLKEVPRGVMRRVERAAYLGGAAIFAPLVASVLEPGVAYPRFYLMQGALLMVGSVALLSSFHRIHWMYKELKKDTPR